MVDICYPFNSISIHLDPALRFEHLFSNRYYVDDVGRFVRLKDREVNGNYLHEPGIKIADFIEIRNAMIVFSGILLF